MNIINFNLRKLVAPLAIGTVLIAGAFALRYASAAPGDLTIVGAPTGTAIHESNASTTVITSFSPDLDLASSSSASLTKATTSSTTGYYGVKVTSATTTGDVYWRITVSHATSTLSLGDVTVTEKGFFDADSHEVADSSYSPAVIAGDLVFTGNSGWEVISGENFTNVDSIVFAHSSPIGTYTVSRTLVDASSTDSIGSPYSFTLALTSATTSHATSSPEIELEGDDDEDVKSCEGFHDRGVHARDSRGRELEASSTDDIDLEREGTYHVTYTTHDDDGHYATSTRTIHVHKCSTSGGSGGSSRGGDRNRNVDNFGSSGAFSGPIIAGEVFSPGSGQVLGASTFQFLINLRLGMRGTDVAELQTRLTSTGYYTGPITGFFGQMTLKSVKAFQKANGLATAGFVGPLTRVLLNS